MIAKGTPHDNGGKLARYLTTGKEGERAELWQLRGFASPDIQEAFRSIHVMAEATNAEQPFFHVQVRNPEGEQLTREQWEKTADRIERMLGLKDQPRAIAFHVNEQTGEEHMHIAWSRIDAEAMRAIPLPFYKERLKKISRELELHFGLTQVTSCRDSEIQFAPTRDEEEQARRLGVDIKVIRNTIHHCFEHSDCGLSFSNALEAEGLILAQGTRRDYVVIDHAGGLHALGKRILGVPASQVRDKLTDLDLNQVPTIEEARSFLLTVKLSEVQRQIEADREYERRDPVREEMAWEDALAKAAIEKEKVEEKSREQETLAGRKKSEIHVSEQELHTTAGYIRLAYNLASGPEAFKEYLQRHRLTAVRVSAQAIHERDAAPDHDETKPRRLSDYAREGDVVILDRWGNAYELNQRTTGKTRQDAQASLAGIGYLPAIEDGRLKLEEDRRFGYEPSVVTDIGLGETAGQIRLAYNLTNGPEAFREYLQQDELTFARVAWQDIRERDSIGQQEKRDATLRAWNNTKLQLVDAEQSLPTTREPGSDFGRLSDYAREGDVVILDKRGNAYELNQRTTGDTRQDAQAFFCGIGSLPSVSHARRELEEEQQQQRTIRLPTGPQQGGMVAHQMWAVRGLQRDAQQRHDEQRRADEWQRQKEERRREQETASKATGEVDPQRYLTDPDYRRQVRAEQSFMTQQERKTEKENDLRALLEQQDRQR